MEFKPKPSAGEFVTALRTTRFAKNIFLAIIALAIVTQLVVFSMVRWGGYIDGLYLQPDVSAASETQPSVTGVVVSDTALGRQAMLNWILAAGKFFALVSGVLLCMTLLFGINVVMLGRLGGTASFVSAFFWSLIALAMLIPWQQVYNGSIASGALFNLQELQSRISEVKASWGANEPSLMRHLYVYMKGLVYPMVLLFVMILVGLKSHRGLRRVFQSAQPSTLAPGEVAPITSVVNDTPPEGDQTQ